MNFFLSIEGALTFTFQSTTFGYISFPDKDGFKSDHVILDRDSYEYDLKDFSFIFVELSKFNKEVDQLYSMVDKWCFFFKHAEETSEDHT